MSFTIQKKRWYNCISSKAAQDLVLTWRYLMFCNKYKETFQNRFESCFKNCYKASQWKITAIRVLHASCSQGREQGCSVCNLPSTRPLPVAYIFKRQGAFSHHFERLFKLCNSYQHWEHIHCIWGTRRFRTRRWLFQVEDSGCRKLWGHLQTKFTCIQIKC